MSWIYVIAPLVAVVLVFIAYLGGKSAGRKEAELKYRNAEQKANERADEIINNNNNLTDSDFATWVQDRNKK
jgi:hypothetical protein